MRITGIQPYIGLNSVNSTPKKISFGLVENEENTRRVLPIRKGDEWQYEKLKKHDAVTVTSEGNKAWATINEGSDEKTGISFKKLYGFLLEPFINEPDNLHNLEKQNQFVCFFDRLTSCDEDRFYGDSGTITKSYSESEERDFWYEANRLN